MRTTAQILAVLLALAGCEGDSDPDDGGPDAASMDAGPVDAAGDDARVSPDASSDAGPRPDGAADTGVVAGDGGAPAAVIDATTMTGKVLFGYQGWFGAQGDGSARDGWRHWSPNVTPAAGNVTFEMWPDLSEWSASELYTTSFTYSDGSPAGLYSAYDGSTVDRHFRWMREYGIDGVFLQEFTSELTVGSRGREFRDQVTRNVMSSASTHGRVWAVMYDISGTDPGEIVSRIREHWSFVVNTLRATASDRYLHHRGRPVVSIWGLGFTSRSATPAIANELLDYFQSGAPAAERATVMGGIPSRWRTLDGDSVSDPAWGAVYRRFDVISPWMVGRYATDDEVRSFRTARIEPDLVAASAAGADYLPVVWPGFAWSNLMPGRPMNQVPRRGGRFAWTQIYEFISAGAPMLYGAMFDEVDEATAWYKISATDADGPREGSFLALDADGESLASDFYLRLAGAASQALRGDIPLGPTPPISGRALMCSPPESMEVDGRCVPSCGAAGGNSCDPVACAGLPMLESYDCAVCCDTG